MYFIILFILMFFSFIEFYINKRYLFRIFLTFSIGVLFFIILGFNSFSPDLDNYKIHYDEIDQEHIKLTIEPVIFYLMTISKNSGLSFEGYQIFFSFLVFSVLTYSIFKYSPLPLFVFLNFYFIPFFPDIVQIRFFLGFVIFLFSLQFIDTKKWLFYILLTISILSHLSLLTMLVFIIIRRFRFFKSQIKSNFIIIIILCLLLLIPKEIIEPILIFFNPKYLIYLNPNAAGSGTIIGTLILFIPFFIINNTIIWHYNNKYSEDRIPEKYSKNVPKFIELIQFSNYLILFQFFIRDFSRITQNLLILSIIYFSIIIFSLKEVRRKDAAKLVSLLVFGSTLIIYYTQFLMVNNFEYFDVIYKTFTSNYLFDSIGIFFSEL